MRKGFVLAVLALAALFMATVADTQGLPCGFAEVVDYGKIACDYTVSFFQRPNIIKECKIFYKEKYNLDLEKIIVKPTVVGQEEVVSQEDQGSYIVVGIEADMTLKCTRAVATFKLFIVVGIDKETRKVIGGEFLGSTDFVITEEI